VADRGEACTPVDRPWREDLADTTLPDQTSGIHTPGRFKYVMGPMYTPPPLMGTAPGEKKGQLQVPGWVGGADWNGGAFDPDTGVLYVPSVQAAVISVVAPGNPKQTNFRYLNTLTPPNARSPALRVCRCSSRPMEPSPRSISTAERRCGRSPTAKDHGTIRC